MDNLEQQVEARLNELSDDELNKLAIHLKVQRDHEGIQAPLGVKISDLQRKNFIKWVKGTGNIQKAGIYLGIIEESALPKEELSKPKENNQEFRHDTIKTSKPWYKKTWIIIVGIVTVLTGLSALVYICESKTGKHFINSFKRKPSISVDYERTPLYVRTKKRVDDFYKNIKNEKLNPWLFINTGVKVQITQCDGKIIHYEGVTFSGAPRLIFWSDDFIPPFIEDSIEKVFDQTIDECRNNPNPELYVYEAKRILSDFIYKIYNRMTDIDQKLMSNVLSKKAGRRDVSYEIDKMCKCLNEHYNAAILLASGNKNPNPHLPSKQIP